MTDDFDYAAFAKQHRANFIERLQNPDFGDFKKRFGVHVPPLLTQLYALGDAMANAPILINVESGSVQIQNFTPMAFDTIEASSKYDWKFFEFAVGSENESLLFPLHGPEKVHVDHEGNGRDVEQTDIEFGMLLDHLKNTLASD